jgi:nucleoside-diphosphate-sugar epimerase
MVILVAGATGFLGSALARSLARRGHAIIGTTRDPSTVQDNAGIRRWIKADYAWDHDVAHWLARVEGVEVAVNAVGIFRESRGKTFESIHVRAPRALFAACVQAGVRVVQISALGADDDAQTAYHLSKCAADKFLLGIDPGAVILQPSLIYGLRGTSAASFNVLAALPMIPLPGSGMQRIQPIHIGDTVDAITAVIERDERQTGRIALVGPEPVTLKQYFAALRDSMGLGKARFIPIPSPVLAIAARVSALFPRMLLSPDSLRMLSRGNTADPSQTCRLLGRPPRPITAFIAPEESEFVRLGASKAWLLAVLRISIAIVWIVSGIVSLGLYPVEESYRLLWRVGVTGAFAPVALYGAALVDLALGIATLVLRGKRWLWAGQAALIVAYTVLISFALPEFWLHPFGPIVKNLPMLAALWLLYECDRR